MENTPPAPIRPPRRQAATASEADDGRLHRALGTPSLSLLTFASVIGSGWLLAAYTVVKLAGPAGIITWVIGGFATLLVCLVFIDLALRHPASGGNTRWPRLASGPLVGTVVSWAILMQAVFAGPSESTAVSQYLSLWWPALVNGDSLSLLGRLFAVALLWVFCSASFFGVVFITRLNNVITTIKLVLPAATIVLLLASGFDPHNIERGGGFAPYGLSAALSAVVGGGVIYAFTGVNGAAVLSGEARNPRRSIPRATLIVCFGSFLLYLGLQLVMIFSPPAGLLDSGWHGLNLDSPLAQLASLLGLGWLSVVLVFDAVFSPSGSMLMGQSIKARYTYGAAQNGLLPRLFARVGGTWGVPWAALTLNAIVGSIVILSSSGWASIASSLSYFYGLSYASVSVAATVLYRAEGPGWLGRLTMPVGAASFVLSGLILDWAGWEKGRIALPLLLIGVVIFLVRRRALSQGVVPPWSQGVWIIGWLVAIGVVSFLGTDGGIGVVIPPLDSIIIGIVSLGTWFLAHRSGVGYQRLLGGGTNIDDLPLTTPIPTVDPGTTAS